MREMDIPSPRSSAYVFSDAVTLSYEGRHFDGFVVGSSVDQEPPIYMLALCNNWRIANSIPEALLHRRDSTADQRAEFLCALRDLL